MATQHGSTSERARTRRSRIEGPDSGLQIARSFAPNALPGPVAAFAAGTIDQARIGRVLMVCARQDEIGSHNWEPFAEWLVDEVRTVNGVHGALILDLRRVTRLSSRGLRALSLGWRELAEGGIIAVCGLKAIPREVFAIAQYEHLFEVYDNSTQAFRAMAQRLQPAH